MLKIDSHINTFFNSITYFLSYKKELYIVDCGDADDIIEYTEKNNLVLKGIFLTHSHFDHIYGLNTLYDKYPQAVVYASEYAKMALYDDRLNLSYYHEDSFIYKGDNVVILKDSDKILLSDVEELNIIATPGHCPSCLCYYTDNYIFTGDSYIPGIKVVTKLPRGNKIKADESVELIHDLAKNRLVYSGH